MRRRFFVERFVEGGAVVQGETAHHLGRVLRAQPGQLYELSDGEQAWLARIEKVGRDRVEFALTEKLPAHHPAVDVTLLLAVVKFDAFEWALEKATELDVNAIVPLAASRSEKALLAAAKKRSERWKKILAQASQQSRRLRLPSLQRVTDPERAFQAHKDGFLLMLSEDDVPPLRKILEGASAKKATVAVGPEGGWTDSEVAWARAAGFQEASLGRLILRTETAVVAALASINYAIDE